MIKETNDTKVKKKTTKIMDTNKQTKIQRRHMRRIRKGDKAYKRERVDKGEKFRRNLVNSRQFETTQNNSRQLQLDLGSRQFKAS